MVSRSCSLGWTSSSPCLWVIHPVHLITFWPLCFSRHLSCVFKIGILSCGSILLSVTGLSWWRFIFHCFLPLASWELRCVEAPRLHEAPNQGSDACILATGLRHVTTRSKELYDTELWASDEIYMFALFFLICFSITQEHFWCAHVFCWINWILNLFMHISVTCWIEISWLFFHFCFLSQIFASFLEFNVVLKISERDQFFI